MFGNAVSFWTHHPLGCIKSLFLLYLLNSDVLGGVYDADGDGDFDVQDAKVLLGECN